MAPSAAVVIESYKLPGSVMIKNMGTEAWNDLNTIEDGPVIVQPKKQFYFGRNLHTIVPTITHGSGLYLYTKDGRKIMDTAGGAAVSALGHGVERVQTAMERQARTGVPYLASSFWKSEVVEEACEELVRGTNGAMSLVYLIGSG